MQDHDHDTHVYLTPNGESRDEGMFPLPRKCQVYAGFLLWIIFIIIIKAFLYSDLQRTQHLKQITQTQRQKTTIR